MPGFGGFHRRTRPRGGLVAGDAAGGAEGGEGAHSRARGAVPGAPARGTETNADAMVARREENRMTGDAARDDKDRIYRPASEATSEPAPASKPTPNLQGQMFGKWRVLVRGPNTKGGRPAW